MAKDFEKVMEEAFGTGDKKDGTRRSDDKRYYDDKRGRKENRTSTMPNSIRVNANLNFSRPNSTRVSHYYSGGGETSSEFIPAVAAVQIDTTVPHTLNALDPVNVAITATYAQLREKISGRKNYDVTDLFFYIVGLREIHKLYHYCAKAVKVGQKYSPINYATPKLYLKAMGFQPTTFIDQLNSWQTFMDVFANRLNALLMPDLYALFKEQLAIYDDFYYDNDATKSQVYTFVPKNWYTVTTRTIAGSYNGLQLTPSSWAAYYNNASASAGIVLSNVQSLADNMFDGLQTALSTMGADFALISGDIARAFNRYVKVKPVSLTDPMPMKYDRNMLQRIQNMTLIASYTSQVVNESVTSSGVRQNWISASATVDSTLAGSITYGTGKIINALVPNPTPQQTIDYIKYAPMAFYKDSTHDYLIDYGYIAAGMNIWKYSLSVSGLLQYFFAAVMDGFEFTSGDTFANLASYVSTLALVSNFDWHPQLRWMGVDTSSGTTVNYPILPNFDIGIWAEYDPANVRDLQPAVVANMMAV